MSGNGIEKSCIDLKMSINASIYICVCVIQDEKWHVGSNQLDIASNFNQEHETRRKITKQRSG